MSLVKDIKETEQQIANATFAESFKSSTRCNVGIKLEVGMVLTFPETLRVGTSKFKTTDGREVSAEFVIVTVGEPKEDGSKEEIPFYIGNFSRVAMEYKIPAKLNERPTRTGRTVISGGSASLAWRSNSDPNQVWPLFAGKKVKVTAEHVVDTCFRGNPNLTTVYDFDFVD